MSERSRKSGDNERSDDLYRETLQVKTELVPLFQKATRSAHGSAGPIGNAGDHFYIGESRGGRTLVVEKGHKAIQVVVPKSEVINFWREYEKLAKETTSLSR